MGNQSRTLIQEDTYEVRLCLLASSLPPLIPILGIAATCSGVELHTRSSYSRHSDFLQVHTSAPDPHAPPPPPPPPGER